MQIGKRLNETDTGRAMSIIYPRLRADLQGHDLRRKYTMAGAGRRMGWHTMETRTVTSVFLRIRCDRQRRRYSRSPAIRSIDHSLCVSKLHRSASPESLKEICKVN